MRRTEVMTDEPEFLEYPDLVSLLTSNARNSGRGFATRCRQV